MSHAARRMMIDNRYRTPTFLGVRTATNSAFVTSVTVQIPSEANKNDVLVLGASMRGTQLFTTPTGWDNTKKLEFADGVTNLTVWWLLCGASMPGTNVTIPIAAAGTEIPSAFCAAYNNINTRTPLWLATITGTGATVSTWPTGEIDNRRNVAPVLCVHVVGSFPFGSYPVSWPAPATERCDVASTASPSRLISLGDDKLIAVRQEPHVDVVPATPRPFATVRLAFNAAHV